MAVHGRYRQPCPVCGAPVQRIRYAENETNYCARCQTGGRLLADRALSRLLQAGLAALDSRTWEAQRSGTVTPVMRLTHFAGVYQELCDPPGRSRVVMECSSDRFSVGSVSNMNSTLLPSSPSRLCRVRELGSSTTGGGQRRWRWRRVAGRCTLPPSGRAVIVVEENHDFAQADSASMPYLHSLFRSTGTPHSTMPTRIRRSATTSG